MTDEEDRLLESLRERHEYLGHSADLSYTSESSFEHITREDRDRVDNDDIRVSLLYGCDYVLETVRRDHFECFCMYTESIRSLRDLRYIFLATNIENPHAPHAVPVCHLQSERRFPYSGFS